MTKLKNVFVLFGNVEYLNHSYVGLRASAQPTAL